MARYDMDATPTIFNHPLATPTVRVASLVGRHYFGSSPQRSLLVNV